MRRTVKEKITVSIAPELVDAVDQEIRAQQAGSRSAVFEAALQLWRTEQHRRAIEQATAAYYRSRSVKEQWEDRQWTQSTSRYANRLRDD